MPGSKNKKILLLLIAMLVFGLTIPMHEAKAFSLTDTLYGMLTGRYIAGYATGLLSGILTGLMRLTSFIPQEVESIWGIVRDFVNMFFILILIIMAFGTIFDIEKYTFKKLFVPFLISAVMINFSFAIGKYILDVSNDMTQIVLQTINEGVDGDVWNVFSAKGFSLPTFMAGSTGGTATTIAKWKSGVTCAIGVATGHQYLGCIRIFTDVALSLIFAIMALFAYMVVGLFLLIRVPFIWMYLIVSPVAWLGYALPNMRKFWTTWWEHYISWCFWVPAYLGILMLLTIILKGRDKTAQDYSTLNVPDKILQFTGLSDWIYFIVTLFFIIGGVYLSFKVGKLFSGLAGKAGEVAQGAIKSIPLRIPGTDFRLKYGEEGRTMSLSDIEGASKHVWDRVKHEGIPEHGPLAGISWLYRGEATAKVGEGSLGSYAARKLGFTGDPKGRKAEMEQINHDFSLLTDEFKEGRVTLKDIREDLDKAIANKSLITKTGNLDPHVMARVKFLANQGALTPEQMENFVKFTHTQNPGFIEDVAETMGRVGAFRNSNLWNEAALKRIVAPIAGSPLSQPGALAFRKQIFMYLTTEDGKKKAGALMSPQAMEEAMNLFGGLSTAVGAGFLREMGNVRADLAANYVLDHSPRSPEAEAKVRAMEENAAYWLGITDPAAIAAFRFDTEYRDKELREFDYRKEMKDILQGDSAVEIANFHKAVWTNEFGFALDDHLLEMQGIMAGELEDISKDIRDKTIDINERIQKLMDKDTKPADKDQIYSELKKYIGNARISGDRFDTGAAVKFRDDLMRALNNSKDRKEKEEIFRKLTKINILLNNVNLFAQAHREESYARTKAAEAERKRRERTRAT